MHSPGYALVLKAHIVTKLSHPHQATQLRGSHAWPQPQRLLCCMLLCLYAVAVLHVPLHLDSSSSSSSLNLAWMAAARADSSLASFLARSA